MNKPNSLLPNQDNLTIAVREGDDPEKVSAKVLTGPYVTNAFALMKIGKGSIGDVKIDNLVTALAESAKAVKANNFAEVEEMLTSQAIVLNVMFGELSRRAAANMGEYLKASELFMRLAFKAQNQCRMTLETLSNIKNPPVVYAKQANIANGLQQVNNGSVTGTRAEESRNSPNKLLEKSNEQRMDIPTQDEASAGNTAMETMGAGNRT